MGRIFGRIFVMLFCTFLLAAVAQAKTLKQVYLKDGGIIECQKVWQADGKVMVLINRYELVDLSKDEVDLKKTFAKKPVKAVKRAKIKKKRAPETTALNPSAVPHPAAKPVAVPATAQKGGAAPTAKPGPVQTAAPAVKPAPQAVKPAPQAVKPAPPALKPAPQAVKPAPPVVAHPQVAKQAAQGTATSAKKPAPAGAIPLTRTSLPVVKPPAPAPKPSFLATNIVNIFLGGLLVLLLAGYVVYKKKQKG